MKNAMRGAPLWTGLSVVLVVLVAAAGCSIEATDIVREDDSGERASEPSPSVAPSAPAQTDSKRATTPGSDTSQTADRASSPPDDQQAVPVTDSTHPSPPGTQPKTPGRRPISITFDDLELSMKLDTKFTPDLLTDRVKQLDGQRVAIKGFIYAAGIFQQTGIQRFPLVKNTQCKFGPGGLAYCVILVELKEGVTTDFTLQPITVEGILKVEPFEGPDGVTWSVYRMVGERVY